MATRYQSGSIYNNGYTFSFPSKSGTLSVGSGGINVTTKTGTTGTSGNVSITGSIGDVVLANYTCTGGASDTSTSLTLSYSGSWKHLYMNHNGHSSVSTGTSLRSTYSYGNASLTAWSYRSS